MVNNRKRVILVGFAFLGVVCSSLAINEDSAKESSCLHIKKAVDPDPTWFSSVKTWYYPLASRLDLYRSAHDLLATDYKNIQEYSLYYDSCLKWGINSKGFTLNGFNGKSRFLRTIPVGPGTSDFTSEWSQGMVGRAYTTLTDNKTFAFTAACFADDQMSWNVFATSQVLDEATKQLIFEHAKSLGYNPEFFTEIRYDSCKGDTLMTNGDSNENEISQPISQPTDSGKRQDSCKTCEKMYQNLLSESKFMFRYYKKLLKYTEIRD